MIIALFFFFFFFFFIFVLYTLYISLVYQCYYESAIVVNFCFIWSGGLKQLPTTWQGGALVWYLIRQQ